MSAADEIIRLYRMHRYSQKYIAKRVGVSEPYVSRVIHEGRGSVKEWEAIEAQANRDDEHVRRLVAQGGFPVGTLEGRWIWPARAA